MKREILIQEFLERSAIHTPDKIGLVCGQQRLSYKTINQYAENLACGLKSNGIKRGDRVGIYLDNSVENAISIFGVLKADAIFVLINGVTKKDKLEFILNDCGATALITNTDNLDIERSIRVPSLHLSIVTGDIDLDYSPDNNRSYLNYHELINKHGSNYLKPDNIDIDMASIMYTSGSTGFPKGVILTHLNMITAANSITEYLENNQDDIIINFLPLSFDYGLYQLLMSFKIGGRLILEQRFGYPASVLDLIETEGVTGFPGVPTIFSILLSLKFPDSQKLRTIRYITNTAAALSPAHIQRLRTLCPNAKIYSMYGLTECKRVTFLHPDDIDKKPNSVGKGMPNEEVYLIDDNNKRITNREGVGELVVRGANVMKGYWNNPEETEKYLKPGPYPWEMQLHTGDIFKIDTDGYLYFLGRSDNILKIKGEKVSPKEIENVLYSIDGILEAAVIGVDDPIWGTIAKAYVSLEEGININEIDIINYCKDNLETICVPKHVKIMKSLPKTESGKISVRQLREIELTS
ncbi:MAG TPA: AMP-binding protein [Candidatus Deferrimicrobiaceae bacterium]|jgi:amino acid adenylation domain-containing protein